MRCTLMMPSPVHLHDGVVGRLVGERHLAVPLEGLELRLALLGERLHELGHQAGEVTLGVRRVPASSHERSARRWSHPTGKNSFIMLSFGGADRVSRLLSDWPHEALRHQASGDRARARPSGSASRLSVGARRKRENPNEPRE